jgi:two-component system, NarL family, response regulator DevR
MKLLNVLLVDDHEVVRMGLRFVLEDAPGVHLVGEAASADEAIVQCRRLQPDVVIMDIKMPGKSGVEACREIVQSWPQINVIMLSSFVDDNLIAEVIQAGAVGYVLKDVGTGELLRALEAVRQGAALLDPAITRRVMAMMRQRGQHGNPFAELTRRELIILHLVSLGKSNAEIALELVLSEKTVRNHLSTILSKLSLGNRVEAATFALQKRISDYLPEA